MFKKILLGLIVRILDSSLKVDYTKIDKKALEEWCFRSFDDRGWRSYFAYEDMKILKELSFHKSEPMYSILVGRRLQLLYLFDEMRRSVENKESAEEKRKSAEKNEAK